jgi:hypothetical protein
MIEHPILFTRPMVRATLAGIKTQTRRLIKELPAQQYDEVGVESLDPSLWHFVYGSRAHSRRCPYGIPGEGLWGRETYMQQPNASPRTPIYHADVPDLAEERAAVRIAKRAGTKVPRWTPSIHMPRWAARLVLEVTRIRVQRIHEITEADALAEGVTKVGKRWEVEGIVATPISAVDAYRALWEYINGRGSWAANPWVWVVDYRWRE